jgi:hypothetical protein
VTLLLVLLALIAYTGLDWWSGRLLDAQVARFEQRHGSLREPSPSPDVPAVENRARLVRAAAALVNTPPAPLRGAVGKLADTSSPGEVTGDLRAFVERSRESIHLLSGLASRPQSDWEGDDVDQVPLLGIRDLGNVLYVDALIALADGRADESAARAVESLDVAQSLQDVDTLISQLIRVAIGSQPLDVIQRLLTQTEVSRASLNDLAGRLAELRRRDPISTGLLGEVRNVERELALAEAGRVSGPGMNPWVGPLGRVGRPLLRLARVRYLAEMERILDVQGGPRPRPSSPAMPPTSRWSPVDRIVDALTPAMERALETGDDFMAAVAGAEIAVALRRYRLDHGAYPDTLALLAPAYLDALPLDPWTGEPPVYSKRDAGFSLLAGRGLRRPLADWIVAK